MGDFELIQPQNYHLDYLARDGFMCFIYVTEIRDKKTA